MARKYGSKAIKTTSKGTSVNQYGVRITAKEKQEFLRLTRNVSQKRRRVLQRVKEKAPKSYLKVPHDTTFAPRKVSTSINQFKSKEEFKQQMTYLKKAIKPTFKKSKVDQYKENYISAMQSVFTGSDYGADVQETNTILNDCINIIRSMEYETFADLVISKKLPNIDFIYFDPDNERLKEIYSVLTGT